MKTAEELAEKYLAKLTKQYIDQANLYKTEWSKMFAFNDVLRAFVAGYAAAQRWIPVTERLPEEDGERVLVYPVGKYYGEVLTFCKYPRQGDGVKANSFIWTCEGITHMEDITHWLPLPAAPKGEG